MSESLKDILNKQEIVNEKTSIKNRVYKLMKNFNMTYGNLFYLFGIDEDEDENKAIYLKRLFYQFIKEEMK